MKDHIYVAVIGVLLVSYGLFGSCGCAAAKPTCEPKTVDVIGAQYARLAQEVIAAGACDKHADIAQCPAYVLLEEHQDLTLRALGCQ